VRIADERDPEASASWDVLQNSDVEAGGFLTVTTSIAALLASPKAAVRGE